MDQKDQLLLKIRQQKTNAPIGARTLTLAGVVALLCTLLLSGSPAFAQETQPIPPDRRADLGDAPDSTFNHHSKDNTAYPGGVLGRFPTVFNGTPAGEPRGPLHRFPDVFWLGDLVSAELEADIGPDADLDPAGNPINNILNGGNDNANNDGGDDGWLNRDADFINCQETELVFRVRKDPNTRQSSAFLNVWYDGNRDGDWADRGRCQPDGHSNEWLVQNFAVNLAAFQDFAEIRVKTALVYNEYGRAPAWVRVMLSDEPAITPPQTPDNPAPVPDGRGPDNGYNTGETEDYITLDLPEAGVEFGDAPDATNHHGLAQEAYPGVPARFPTVWEVPSTDISGPAHRNPFAIHLGERVSPERDADLLPDADPTTNITDNGANVNAMNNDSGDDGWLNAAAATFPDCGQQELRVRFFRHPAVAGREMYLNVYFDGNRNGRWGERKECPNSDNPNQPNFGHEWIVQNMPIDTSAFTGTMDLAVPSMMLMNEAPDKPAWVRFILSEEKIPELAPFQHDGRGPQYPRYFSFGETEDYPWHPDRPNDVPYDTGDAPDATNHHGLAQEAYPGVLARFPTVWDGPGPSGPLHENPKIVWLGEDVTGERDADLPPDMDPTTNITDNGSNVNAMNNDGGDDGWLNRRTAVLPDCGQERLKVRVSEQPGGPDIKVYLNVYIDGNRNGQWGERKQCPKPDNPNETDFGHEWIVQNFPIDTSAFVGSTVLDVPTMMILNEAADKGTWLRFTISEEPVKGAVEFEHDGSGPQAPARWRLGETEDYPWKRDVPPDDRKPDLGDAPDSTNHHGLANPAYPALGVPGNFPTVWEGSTPSGPRHQDATVVRLGTHVSGEGEADQGPDEDGVNNILDGGADASASNKDEHDDGWLNRKNIRIRDCEETRLRVRLSKEATSGPIRVYLNGYFDGNRDGTWGQRKECPKGQTDPNAADFAHEWMVQNFPVVMPAAATAMDIVVPTMIVLNDKPEQPAWVRLTVSEQKVVELAPFEHDGRGPQHPAQYEIGETEDYLHVRDVTGQPGDIVIRKRHSDDDGGVTVGDAYSYTVEIGHTGGTAPAELRMRDQLPPQVELMGKPVFEVLGGDAETLNFAFEASEGPAGTLYWKGVLAPDSRVAITFPVKVRHCLPNRPVIRNVAELFSPDGTKMAEAIAELRSDCQPPQPPEITLEKRVIRDGREDTETPNLEAEIGIIAGKPVGYALALKGKSSTPQTIVISDSLPSGVLATGVQASRGEIVIRDDGRTVLWRLRIGPNAEPARAVIDIKPTERLECEQRIVNVAHWMLVEGDEILHRGQSNRAIIYLLCADLGDAPDSSNHFPGTGMDAYPGVPARFPTVFDPATGPDQGPKHLRSRALHLGRGVTEEREADRGIDQDPTNNIIPLANRPNRDERDDGLLRSQLTLENCRIARFPVLVAIDPAALAALPADAEGIGFINVWLDSNRDGDWADRYECPVDGQASVVGYEHIVVDHKVDVRALGPGIHTVFLTTNWPVSWNEEQARQLPAWMRVTIAGRPANKVLDCGGGPCRIGDGRGYDTPFFVGETEDYLIRSVRQGDPPTDGADPIVHKEGHLEPQRDPRTGQVFWLATYGIRYSNQGSVPATNVKLTDTMEGPQTFRRDRVPAGVVAGGSGNTRTYDVGNLAPGAGGQIILQATVPISTAPGTVMTNTVVISADRDDDTSNNTSVVSLRVPLLPPNFVYPLAGTTCAGDLTIVGRAQPGTSVELTIVDDSGTTVETTTVATDASGKWTHSTTLADGEYDITAVAKIGSLSSDPATVHVIVNSSLFWNPMSLRFTAADGSVAIPYGPDGRLDETGWRVFLRRGTLYTVSLEVCCDTTPVVTVKIPDVGTLNLTDPDGDGTYTASFTTPSTGPITGNIVVCVTCGLIKQCSDGRVLIDPEGTVFDILTGKEVEAATVACMVEENTGNGSAFTLWNAADFEQVNPQTTGSDGYFSFFTPAGTYRVEVSKDGYQSYRSPDLVVVDAPVHHDVPLTPEIVLSAEAQATTAEVLVTDSGFEPAILTIAPNTTVKFTNLSVTLRGVRSISPTVSFEASAAELKSSDGFDSGLLNGGDSYLRQLTTEGTYTYVDIANPTVTGTIIVKQEEPQAEEKIYLPALNR